MTSRAHSSAQILPVDPISLRVKAEILTMSIGATGSLIHPRLSSFPFLGARELSAFLVLVLSHTWARSPGSTHLGISPHPLPFTLPRNPRDCTSLLSSQMLLPILSKLQTSLLPASFNCLFSLGLNTIFTYTQIYFLCICLPLVLEWELSSGWDFHLTHCWIPGNLDQSQYTVGAQ